MHQLLQTIQDSTQIDIVVIDTPPALGFAHVAVLAVQVDGVILTLNAQRTREVSLIETMEVFKKVNARIAGIILVNVKENKSNSYLNSVYNTSSKELSVVDTNDSDLSSIDELIDLSFPIIPPVNNEANISHQENLIEPFNGSTGDVLNKDTRPFEVEDVTITFPHPVKHSLRED